MVVSESTQDEVTVRLLRAGMQEGLHQLLLAHGPRIKGALTREFGRTLDEGEIDEAINNGAFRAWQSFGTFDAERGTLRAWFFTICRNCALRVLERESNQRAVQLGSWDSVGSDRNSDALGPSALQRRLLEALRRCVQRLPRLQRAIIEADLMSGYVADASALALEFNTTKNSIYASRSLARKTIRAALEVVGYRAGETHPGRDDR